MKVAVLTFSTAGDKIFQRYFSKLGYNLFSKSNDKNIKKKDFKNIWTEYDGIIFVSATGIAVRYIGDLLESKDRDPAILVIDDQKRFVISLLSGHLGGANEWANFLSKKIDATPVVTTASDSRGFTSLDLFAKNNNYYIEDLSALTPVAAAMVNNDKVAFYSEENIILDYPNLIICSCIEDASDNPYSVIVTKKEVYKKGQNQAVLRPKTLHLGIGSRKGTKSEDLLFFLKNVFKKNNLSIHSIKDISTIDIKKDEQAIISLKENLNVDLHIFTREDLLPFEQYCKGSEFVKKTVGVSSVSCTCALKLSKNLIIDKLSYKGFTLSISEEK